MDYNGLHARRKGVVVAQDWIRRGWQPRIHKALKQLGGPKLTAIGAHTIGRVNIWRAQNALENHGVPRSTIRLYCWHWRFIWRGIFIPVISSTLAETPSMK